MFDLEGEYVMAHSHRICALILLIVAGLVVVAPKQASAQARRDTRAVHWVALGAPEQKPVTGDVAGPAPLAVSSRGTGAAALRGGAIGMLVGGIVGFVVGDASCQRCDEPAPVFVATGIGALVGGVVGLYVGAVRASSAVSRSPAPASSAWPRPNGAFQLPASRVSIPNLDSSSHARHHPASMGRS